MWSKRDEMPSQEEMDNDRREWDRLLEEDPAYLKWLEEQEDEATE